MGEKEIIIGTRLAKFSQLLSTGDRYMGVQLLLALLLGIFPTRIEPGSPALQVDSLLSEPPGKPMYTNYCTCE